MLKKILFGITQIILGLIISISGCKDNPINNSNNSSDFCVTDFEPAWSPDGNTIAYVHGDTIIGQTGIWLIDINNNNKRIIYASVSAYSPTWSPDGQWIAFSDQAHIFKMKLNGDSLTQLTVTGRNFFPAWSSDGQLIAFDSNNESVNGMNFVWTMKVDGSQKKKIAYDPSNGEIRMPNWSSDKNRIVHIRYLIDVFSSEIFSMDNDGTNIVRLTFNNSTDYFPKYSPDGSMVAFTSQPNEGKSQIWIMNSDGSNLYQLTTTQGYSCDWSSTGEWVVYTDSRGVNGKLWLIRSDGNDNHQLTF